MGRFPVVLVKGNTLRCLKKNCSFACNSVSCVGNTPFRLVALLFAAVTSWQRQANWLMVAALFTLAANFLILARTRNMTWSQTLQSSSFFHQNFLSLNKILNLFTGGRIMQFLAINTSGNIFPAVLLGKQRACGGNWRFSSRRLAVFFTCFNLLAGFSGFNFFLSR